MRPWPQECLAEYEAVSEFSQTLPTITGIMADEPSFSFFNPFIMLDTRNNSKNKSSSFLLGCFFVPDAMLGT